MTVLEMWLASFQQIWSRDNKTAICSFESSPPPTKKNSRLKWLNQPMSSNVCRPASSRRKRSRRASSVSLTKISWVSQPIFERPSNPVQWLPEETSDWKPTENQTFPSCSGARVDSSTWLSNGWMMLGDWLWLSVFWARFSGHLGFSSFDESLDFIVRSTPTLYEHYYAGNKISGFGVDKLMYFSCTAIYCR